MNFQRWTFSSTLYFHFSIWHFSVSKIWLSTFFSANNRTAWRAYWKLPFWQLELGSPAALLIWEKGGKEDTHGWEMSEVHSRNKGDDTTKTMKAVNVRPLENYYQLPQLYFFVLLRYIGVKNVCAPPLLFHCYCDREWNYKSATCSIDSVQCPRVSIATYIWSLFLNSGAFLIGSEASVENLCQPISPESKRGDILNWWAAERFSEA